MEQNQKKDSMKSFLDWIDERAEQMEREGKKPMSDFAYWGIFLLIMLGVGSVGYIQQFGSFCTWTNYGVRQPMVGRVPLEEGNITNNINKWVGEQCWDPEQNKTLWYYTQYDGEGLVNSLKRMASIPTYKKCPMPEGVAMYCDLDFKRLGKETFGWLMK